MSKSNELPSTPIGLNLSAGVIKFLDEVLAKYESIKLNELSLEPTFLETTLASERRQAIEEAKISAIKARKDLIDSLKNGIAIYFDIDRAQIKISTAAWIQTTFNELITRLYRLNEEGITNSYKTFIELVDEYEKIPHLTDEMKKQLTTKAFLKADKLAALNYKIFDTIFENIVEQVKKLPTEIG